MIVLKKMLVYMNIAYREQRKLKIKKYNLMSLLKAIIKKIKIITQMNLDQNSFIMLCINLPRIISVFY